MQFYIIIFIKKSNKSLITKMYIKVIFFYNSFFLKNRVNLMPFFTFFLKFFNVKYVYMIVTYFFM